MIAPRSADALSVSRSGALTWGRFAADVAALRPRLRDYDRVCNLLPDRYDFNVGLVAALLESRRTILPPSGAPEAIARSIGPGGAPLALGRLDHTIKGCAVMERLEVGGAPIDPAPVWRALNACKGEVHVFTSGSTGQPERHAKTWFTLTSGAALTDKLLRFSESAEEPYTLIGTTPHQHMYGLEAVISASLGFGRPAWRSPIFFSEDLVQAVAALKAQGRTSIALITSPAHLKFLEAAIGESPEIKTVVSATAPLSVTLAERLEANGARSVYEIFGSTETGSMAWRCTSKGAAWTLLEGFSLRRDGVVWRATAPHLKSAQALADIIDLEEDGRFVLIGRNNDMVNVAGRRASLAALNLALADVGGLKDAVYLRRAGERGDDLAIAAVIDPACMRSEAELRGDIKRCLAARIDPIFIPRRIVFVDALPRSKVGKISDRDMKQLMTNLGV